MQQSLLWKVKKCTIGKLMVWCKTALQYLQWVSHWNIWLHRHGDIMTLTTYAASLGQYNIEIHNMTNKKTYCMFTVMFRGNSFNSPMVSCWRYTTSCLSNGSILASLYLNQLWPSSLIITCRVDLICADTMWSYTSRSTLDNLINNHLIESWISIYKILYMSMNVYFDLK